MVEEAGLLLDAGIDGFFTDHPAEGRLAVDRHVAGKEMKEDGRL
jgi:hypothetical protein